jgi:hypothetical protein
VRFKAIAASRTPVAVFGGVKYVARERGAGQTAKFGGATSVQHPGLWFRSRTKPAFGLEVEIQNPTPHPAKDSFVQELTPDR